MHVEDMHTRRLLRMLLIRFERGSEPEIPEDLALSVRERNGDTLLLEHRGDLASLLRWLGFGPRGRHRHWHRRLAQPLRPVPRTECPR